MMAIPPTLQSTPVTPVFQTGAKNNPPSEDQPLINNTDDLTKKYGFYEIGLSGNSPRPLLTSAESPHENPCLQSIADVVKRCFSCCDSSEFCFKTLPDLYTARYEIDEDNNSSWDELSEEIESCI